MAPAFRSLEGGFIPVDIDVSPFDNSGTAKQGMGYTYKGVDGYASIFAYLGREGYLLNAELREGTQHSQKNFVPFLETSLDLADSIRKERAPGATVLVRMDSAHDSVETIEALRKRSGTRWILARNFRGRKDADQYMEIAQAHGNCEHPREGKEVWTGQHDEQVGGKLQRLIVQATRRTTTPDGQQ